jgi:hypothetical protein
MLGGPIRNAILLSGILLILWAPTAAFAPTLEFSAHLTPSPRGLQGPQGDSAFSGVLTWHNDNFRDGQNTQEIILTPGNVETGFGELFRRGLDGALYAQPLYVPNVIVKGYGPLNVVYVATENDSVYAFDADGNIPGPLWHDSFTNAAKGITAIPAAATHCDVITPEIGITGTPVIDPSTNTLYVVAAAQHNGMAFMKLHALALGSGAEQPGSPVPIEASAGGVKFDPAQHLQRAGLLLENGQVYAGFGSHCDFPPYHGWLMGYDAATLRQTAVFLATPTGEQGSLWAGGAGPSVDEQQNIYASTGNGTFTAATGGSDYGDSVVKLDPGSLRVTDYFTPFNHADLTLSDLDLGSSGCLLLPEQLGSHPHALVTAGKEGRIYVVNRDNLGGYHAGGDTQILESIAGAFPKGLYAGPAYWNGLVYFFANGDVLKAYALSDGMLSITPVAMGAVEAAFPGATPSVSSNGPSAGIVWTVEGRSGEVSLRASAASNVAQTLFYSGAIPGMGFVKFSTATIANGKVYFGTQIGLEIFGLHGEHLSHAGNKRGPGN